MTLEYKPFSLGELKDLTKGEVLGDSEIKLEKISFDPINAKEKELCFILSNKLLEPISKSEIKAGAFVLETKYKSKLEAYKKTSCQEHNFLFVRNPKLALKLILDQYGPTRQKTKEEIHKTASIEKSAQLGKQLRIGANVYIGENTKIGDQSEICANSYLGHNVQIGKNCLIKANVVIEEHSIIGDNVIIHSGSVIGADGFSFVTEKPAVFERFNLLNAHRAKELPEEEKEELLEQEHLKVKSVGFVIIEDNVEIGANTCIDKGTLGPTKIGKGSKIDNLVQIGHNCILEENCLIAGCVGLSGSVKLKKGVVFAAGAGAKSVEIAPGVVIGAVSNVREDANEAFDFLIGTPARSAKEFIRRERVLERLLRKKQDK